MSNRDLDKSRWLGEAKKIAESGGMKFEEEGDCLYFPAKGIKDFKRRSELKIDRDRAGIVYTYPSRESETGIYLFNRIVGIPENMIQGLDADSGRFNEVWTDFIKEKLGYERLSEIEGWGRHFDKPEDAIEEVKRILSDWIPDLFEFLSMVVATIDTCIYEVDKRIKATGGSDKKTT